MSLRLDHYDLLKSGAIPAAGTEHDGNRKYRSRIPEGESGDWAVQRFKIEIDLQLMRMMRDGRGTPPGEYTRLHHKRRGVIMSDTDAEIDDHRKLFRKAKGRVLIHGLGLGVAVCGCLARPEVTRVDVVELERDVIDLVAPHIVDDRLFVHHGDCLTHKWPRGSHWEVVWHDIWDNICGDNLPQMQTLCRKFGRRCDWQGCWAREWIR